MPAICPPCVQQRNHFDGVCPMVQDRHRGVQFSVTHLFTCTELYTPKSGLDLTRHLSPKVRFALPATGRETWPIRQKRIAPWEPLVGQVKLIQFASLCWGMLVRLRKSCIFRTKLCLSDHAESSKVLRWQRNYFCYYFPCHNIELD